MKLIIRYQHADWWFWLVITVSIGFGLAGWRDGFSLCAGVSVLNLVYYVVHDRSLTSFAVQVREVWLALVLVALWPPMWWLFIPLFIGMLLVVLCDRCGIARVLIRMPWNRDVKLN